MENGHYLLTSESVSEGHPDKLCDQISDAVLDEALRQDPLSRVACEAAVADDLAMVFGEITTTAVLDVKRIVQMVFANAGYTNPDYGVVADNLGILQKISEQSRDIKSGVDVALETRNGSENRADIGAGDQGMMFGYATVETSDLMPLPIVLAHQLTKRLAEVRKRGEISYLRPDAKSQVTVEYTADHKPVRINAVVISSQHDPDVSNETISEDIDRHVIEPIVQEHQISCEGMHKFINPSGRFVIGGPVGDAGLTGRKIIADTYGGGARHGGGAFSGKDPTKVDRSGAYAARHVAKNITAAGLAERAEVQIAYAIGMANPVSIMLDTFGTESVPKPEIVKLIKDLFDLRPGGIIENMQLRRPIYLQTATYGHFGRSDLALPWEKLDMVDALQERTSRFF